MPHGLAVPAFGLTLLLASLSWWLFEGPINNLKQYFPYPSQRRAEIHTRDASTT
jgi:peptidoglycan/LPS O-acetylase OafA/YrhL